jgi:hypothetical protein
VAFVQDESSAAMVVRPCVRRVAGLREMSAVVSPDSARASGIRQRGWAFEQTPGM